MPTLKDLSYLLRHREEWPEGFYWDYTNMGTCAAGLAEQKFNLHLPDDEYWTTLAEVFGITDTIAIFVGAARKSTLPRHNLRSMRDVTPERVADVIDAL